MNCKCCHTTIGPGSFSRGEDLEKLRIAAGLTREVDFSNYEAIIVAIFTTFWATGRTFLIVGTTFFKNLILASVFESLKDSVV
jgi:hypothetical protein